jgi:hypothetical protein
MFQRRGSEPLPLLRTAIGADRRVGDPGLTVGWTLAPCIAVACSVSSALRYALASMRIAVLNVR